MKLLVGLGNPGNEYENTRHNIGFMAVDEICYRHNFSPFKQKFQGELAEGKIANEKILALKPMTYMNLSGQSVNECASFYKIEPEDIIVVHDELDLPTGKLRIKTGGGHGGHNGLRDIDNHLGKNYVRIRLGIDHPGHKDEVTKYVLRPFNKEDKETIDTLLPHISDTIPLLIQEEPEKMMTEVALRTQPPKPTNTKPTESKES